LDLMIDIEALDVNPSATILTIGAQMFDPLGEGVPDGDGYRFYCRVSPESQTNRTIDDSTVAWWSTQPPEAQEEAFGEDNRIDMRDALEQLYKLIWKSTRVWANGINYDMTILEHAFKEQGMPLPWKYHVVRDTRTVYGLWKELPKPVTAHHALDDCWRQIALLQATLQHLGIRELA
jgi:hypothetical protein